MAEPCSIRDVVVAQLRPHGNHCQLRLSQGQRCASFSLTVEQAGTVELVTGTDPLIQWLSAGDALGSLAQVVNIVRRAVTGESMTLPIVVRPTAPGRLEE